MNSFQCTRLKGKLSQLKEGGNVVSPDEKDKVRESVGYTETVIDN